VGNSDDTYSRTRTSDGEGGLHRLIGPDTFERSVDADPIRELEQCLDRRVTACIDDVGGTERACDVLARRVAAEDDDAFRAQTLRREHGGESDGSVAHHRDDVPFGDAGTDRSVVSRRHDVRQREQCFEHLVGVPGTGDGHECAAGQGYAHGFTLAAVDLAVAECSARGARDRGAVLAMRARHVAEDERRYHEVADRDAADLGPDVFYDADELVADRTDRVR
jgi:hypothetical protein